MKYLFFKNAIIMSDGSLVNFSFYITMSFDNEVKL
jgi:hypothetical protein